MDLPEIGSHCSLETCNDLDLLPILCPSCKNLFCRHHFSLESHGCSSNTLAASVDDSLTRVEKRQRCALQGCGKPSLESAVLSPDASEKTERLRAVCPRCQLSFCAAHRYPDSHSCTVPELVLLHKNEAAHALLAKHFPSTPESSSPATPNRAAKIPKLPTDPAKLALYRKVELMKMRRSAFPADPKDVKSGAIVALDDRLHLKVKFEDSASQEKLFWFRKTVSTGKAVDLLSSQFGLPSTSLHQLRKGPTYESEDQTALRNDQPLAQQVDECSTVILAVIET